MLLFLLSLALADSQPELPPADELPAITVRGQYIDYRLRVGLQGAEAATDLIVSADPAMNCGDVRFDRTPGPYRQCWLRGRRNASIRLLAHREGEFGRDWTVDWTGCEPRDGGRSCEVAISSEILVGATFRTL
ncbi:MAG: hypothetical protein J0L52_12585 [Caulobacterales bacterium]|nr:hypothetical protein [Caulobacterales bacterium]